MSEPFAVVDATTLSDEHRALLRPGELTGWPDRADVAYPRFFYRVESWAQARETKLTAHFTLSELMSVDCREAPLLFREFPHYVPCAISILARYLETFRERVEAPVFVSVNGGYRSPAHAFSQPGDGHPWAAAADIYRIGDHWLDDEKTIDRFSRIATGIGQEVTAAPFGPGPGQTDDHLHFSIGCVHWAPNLSVFL